jgi:hypothetical protein
MCGWSDEVGLVGLQRSVVRSVHMLHAVYCPSSQLARGEGGVHWVVDRDPGSLCIGDGMDDMHSLILLTAADDGHATQLASKVHTNIRVACRHDTAALHVLGFAPLQLRHPVCSSKPLLYGRAESDSMQ